MQNPFTRPMIGLILSVKSRYDGLKYILTLAFCLLPSLSSAVTVNTVAELVQAVEQANSGGDKEILLENGIYSLNSAIVIQSDGMTVRSVSGNRSAVTVQGTGMVGSVSHIFLVQADNFTATDMTLGNVYYHAIQMQPSAQTPTMINLHVFDTYEQMIKVAYDPGNPDVHSDNGLVENCLFEYTAGIGPQYYIGGVDAHHALNWIVRGNTFKNIRSPSQQLAEHAIHFWNNSQNTLVERNLIINCDRGIGFGLGYQGHVGGIIRNNMIYHHSSEGFADVGIGLESAPDAQVYNNSIYQEHTYPNAIEYRFTTTTGVIISNNLTNKTIAGRDGASATCSNNITNAVTTWFANPPTGDLHLLSPVPTVVDQGLFITGLDDDIDRDVRPQGGGYDIGADEYMFSESCPDCSDDVVVIDNATFTSGATCECLGATSITIGPEVVIQRGATVTFNAPIVKVNPGFHVENGSTVHMRQH
jgi:hypothetical protein